MQQMIEKLKAKRQELIEATEQVSVAETRLKKTERYQELQRAKDVLFNVSTELDALDKLLRQSAIDYFEKTGDKNPVDGVKVIILKSVKYDPIRAINWAIINNVQSVLKLDKRQFEKHAKAVADTMPIGFVEIKEVPAVRISKETH